MQLIEVMSQMYRMAGVVLRPGVGLSGSEMEEGLHITNALLDGVKTERFFFYQILRTVFGVTIGIKDYTVGSASLGANWELERPEKVLRTGIIVPGSSSALESEIRIQTVLSFEEYANIVAKDVASSLPLVLYYQASVPLGVATIWPVPRATKARQVVLYTPQTVQEFESADSEFIVPKGFREFLEYNGAVSVHDRYPKNVMDPNVRMKAVEYKKRVKAMLTKPVFISADYGALSIPRPLIGGAFNGRTMIPG